MPQEPPARGRDEPASDYDLPADGTHQFICFDLFASAFMVGARDPGALGGIFNELADLLNLAGR